MTAEWATANCCGAVRAWAFGLVPGEFGGRFGGCAMAGTSPARDQSTSSVEVVNVVLSLEDVLRLGLAADERVRKLNSDNRSTGLGRNAAVNVAVNADSGRMTVGEDVHLVTMIPSDGSGLR